MTFYETTSHHQCPNGNSDDLAYETIVSTARGNYSTLFEFPKLHPGGGLITSVRLCITITGRGMIALETNITSSSVVPCLNVRQFTVTQLPPHKAEIRWTDFDDFEMNYDDKVKASNNGSNFSPIHSVPKNSSGTNYKFIYVGKKNESRSHFFGLKQVYSNGYTRFSEIKSIELGNSVEPKINIYPNPANGVVGIKFVNIFSGKFLIQISNTQVQTVFSEEVDVCGDEVRYRQRYREECIG
jgi:hypothetical protein